MSEPIRDEWTSRDGRARLILGDCRAVLPNLNVAPHSIITDPVWPDCSTSLAGADRAEDLFDEMLESLRTQPLRIAVQLGCDTHPNIVGNVQLPFFRVAWLEYTRPSFKGRLMYGSDVAYLFGTPPKSREGARVVPG